MCLSVLSANNPTSFSGQGLTSRAHSCQRINDAATATQNGLG